jgi:peptidoglycan DL-endopeptidase CwlO
MVLTRKKKPVPPAPPAPVPPEPAPQAPSDGQRIVDVALKYQSSPYVWGGKTPSGFDCSGYVAYVIKEALGIAVSGDSHE